MSGYFWVIVILFHKFHELYVKYRWTNLLSYCRELCCFLQDAFHATTYLFTSAQFSV